MVKKILRPLALLAALFLECLPFGAVLMFANPEGDSYRRTYSYFDPTPFGYANFAPFVTAILTAVAVIMAIFFIALKKPTGKAYLGISTAAVVLSIMPFVFFSAEYYPPTALFISVALALHAVITAVS